MKTCINCGSKNLSSTQLRKPKPKCAACIKKMEASKRRSAQATRKARKGAKNVVTVTSTATSTSPLVREPLIDGTNDEHTMLAIDPLDEPINVSRPSSPSSSLQTSSTSSSFSSSSSSSSQSSSTQSSPVSPKLMMEIAKCEEASTQLKPELALPVMSDAQVIAPTISKNDLYALIQRLQLNHQRQLDDVKTDHQRQLEINTNLQLQLDDVNAKLDGVNTNLEKINNYFDKREVATAFEKLCAERLIFKYRFKADNNLSSVLSRMRIRKFGKHDCQQVEKIRSAVRRMKNEGNKFAHERSIEQMREVLREAIDGLETETKAFLNKEWPSEDHAGDTIAYMTSRTA